MRNTHIKKRIVNVSNGEQQLVYYTEEELNQIKIEKKEREQLELLDPSQKEIEKAEFEINVLILLEEVGII